MIDPSQSICLPGHQWKVTDVIAIASLVAGIFGKGGGGELGAALALEAARQRFGPGPGKRVWADFQAFNDPEAPTTVHDESFPYGQPPAQPRGLALPDPGTLQFSDVAESASASAEASGSGGELPGGMLEPLLERNGASNALLVSARESKSGHPVAVMGPQVGYWSPEILMEEDIHAPATAQGPAIDARGAAFPGTNLYVQLGRGRDYSWSATSAGQDIIDTYAVKLCEPGGGTATINSDHYLFNGQCLPFDVLTRTNSWVPTPADQTPAGLPHADDPAHQAGGRDRPRDDQRPAPRLHEAALHLLPRGRSVRARLRRLQRPEQDAHAPGLHAGGEPHRLHVQLVLRRQQEHRLLQLRRQPHTA